MPQVKLSSKNQIVVPREARKALRVKAGDRLLVVVRGEEVIVLKKPRKYSEAIRGMAKRPYPASHVREERKAWE